MGVTGKRKVYSCAGNKKAHEIMGLSENLGGYRWTRTTDPVIMSDVL